MHTYNVEEERLAFKSVLTTGELDTILPSVEPRETLLHDFWHRLSSVPSGELSIPALGTY